MCVRHVTLQNVSMMEVTQILNLFDGGNLDFEIHVCTYVTLHNVSMMEVTLILKSMCT